LKRIGCILLMLLPIGGVAPSLAATAPPELVTQIQNDLTSLGYDPGPADGSLDQRTGCCRTGEESTERCSREELTNCGSG
jgi:hypothetical protein